MALIPQNKEWKQLNDGDSLGNVSSTWGIDLKNNRGSANVSNPLKKVFDDNDIATFTLAASSIIEFNSRIWATSDRMFYVPTTGDITDGDLWVRDSEAGTPDPTATSDSVIFAESTFDKSSFDTPTHLPSFLTPQITNPPSVSTKSNICSDEGSASA